MLPRIYTILAQFTKPSSLPDVTADTAKIQVVVNIVFGILGAIAALIITIAGFRFVIHQGDPQEVNKARNSIIFACVGLIVALSAWAIVSFVLTKL